MDKLPFWALFLLSALIATLSIELGWRIGFQRQKQGKAEKQAPTGAAVGSTLGLLAFLLAFTFGMAAARFDTRKQNVLNEANAIGTTYLRADFLPEAARDEVRSLLREYVVLRSGGMSAIMSQEGMEKTAALQDQVWAVSASAMNTKDTVSTAIYIESLNQMIDLDAARVVGLRNRIPSSIWLALGVVTFFAMASMGYEFGLSGQRSWVVTILLVIVFTAVIVLIVDLDRPQTGLIQVSQQPLIDLIDRIGAPTP